MLVLSLATHLFCRPAPSPSKLPPNCPDSALGQYSRARPEDDRGLYRLGALFYGQRFERCIFHLPFYSELSGAPSQRFAPARRQTPVRSLFLHARSSPSRVCCCLIPVSHFGADPPRLELPGGYYSRHHVWLISWSSLFVPPEKFPLLAITRPHVPVPNRLTDPAFPLKLAPLATPRP